VSASAGVAHRPMSEMSWVLHCYVLEFFSGSVHRCKLTWLHSVLNQASCSIIEIASFPCCRSVLMDIQIPKLHYYYYFLVLWISARCSSTDGASFVNKRYRVRLATQFVLPCYTDWSLESVLTSLVWKFSCRLHPVGT
jgi:hypothetical protein